MSCFDAAQEMGIDYENAKLIFRVFRNEGRVKQTPKHVRRFIGEFKKDPVQFVQKMHA